MNWTKRVFIPLVQMEAHELMQFKSSALWGFDTQKNNFKRDQVGIKGGSHKHYSLEPFIQ